MNKFTLIVEGDEVEITPEQELENAWIKFNADKPTGTDPLLMNNAFKFYYEIRQNTDFDHETVFNFVAKKGLK